ncbi:hypothetical protein [Terrisporobacter glycolicus]|uniref:Chloramphenicol resistance protein n=1 Tax=Terrisporobacter glycolicus ATCC 14880 = DSM 1288 TaxID=1121315 RepID=A0ABZ2EW30_9FIRM|nr:hypothetical protein [Terrisporobacter glycolicus]
MTILEAIRNYIKECPYLSEFSRGINVDYLGENTNSYSIESIPATPIVRRYVDGSSIRQFLFVFSSREAYGQDAFQNLENIGFYELFSKWIEQQNRLRKLPDLGEGKTVRKIETLTTGYTGEIMDMQMDKCRYQIQCRIEYFQDKGVS